MRSPTSLNSDPDSRAPRQRWWEEGACGKKIWHEANFSSGRVRARQKDVELHSQKCLPPESSNPPAPSFLVSPLSRADTQPRTRMKSTTVNGRGRSTPFVRVAGGGGCLHPHGNGSSRRFAARRRRVTSPRTRRDRASHPEDARDTWNRFIQLQQCGPRASASVRSRGGGGPRDRRRTRDIYQRVFLSCPKRPVLHRRMSCPPRPLQCCPPRCVSLPSQERWPCSSVGMALESSVGSAVLALHILGPTLDAPLILLL